MDTARINRWLDLEVARKAAKAEFDRIVAEMKELADPIVSDMLEAGIPEMSNGKVKAKLNRVIVTSQAKGMTKIDVANALVASGLGDYVSPDYNANSLSAYIRSVEAEFGDGMPMSPEEIKAKLPKPLASAVNVLEVYQLKALNG